MGSPAPVRGRAGRRRPDEPPLEALADRPLRSGLLVGLGAAAAVALALAVVAAAHALVLLLVGAFLAVGLDPAVRRLQAWRLPRPAAVAVVLLAVVAAVAGFLALAEPVLVTQARELSGAAPRFLADLQRRHDAVGSAARSLSAGGGPASALGFHGVLEAGGLAYGAVTSTVAVAALTAYLLADLPRIQRAALRLAPRSRRQRASDLADEVLRRTGGYLAGDLVTSAICGVANGAFLAAIGVPSAVFLGLLTAVFDLVPIIGAPLAGGIAALVALSVSLPKAIATVAFVAVFRLLEDYLITPRVMRRAVEVDALTSIIAVLVGGAALGVVGALVAVPVAASLSLLVDELVLPAMESA